jgi:hypothetical protein
MKEKKEEKEEERSKQLPKLHAFGRPRSTTYIVDSRSRGV